MTTQVHAFAVDAACDHCGIMLSEVIQEQAQEIARLTDWVNDLHSGMLMNCVYCGHRYGPRDGVEAAPVSQADVLKTHVERCPKHPMSALRQQLADAYASHQAYVDEMVRGTEELVHEVRAAKRATWEKVWNTVDSFSGIAGLRERLRYARADDLGE